MQKLKEQSVLLLRWKPLQSDDLYSYISYYVKQFNYEILFVLIGVSNVMSNGKKVRYDTIFPDK